MRTVRQATVTVTADLGACPAHVRADHPGLSPVRSWSSHPDSEWGGGPGDMDDEPGLWSRRPSSDGHRGRSPSLVFTRPLAMTWELLDADQATERAAPPSRVKAIGTPTRAPWFAWQDSRSTPEPLEQRIAAPPHCVPPPPGVVRRPPAGRSRHRRCRESQAISHRVGASSPSWFPRSSDCTLLLPFGSDPSAGEVAPTILGCLRAAPPRAERSRCVSRAGGAGLI